jgi:hypothetical protein
MYTHINTYIHIKLSKSICASLRIFCLSCPVPPKWTIVEKICKEKSYSSWKEDSCIITVLFFCFVLRFESRLTYYVRIASSVRKAL